MAKSKIDMVVVISLMEEIKMKATYLSECNPNDIKIEKLMAVNKALGTDWTVDKHGDMTILKKKS